MEKTPMPETPVFDALVAEFETLRDEVIKEASRADSYRAYCEQMRPVWATMNDGQAATAALASIWKALGVTDQTAAMQKINKLLDNEPELDGRRARTLELYLALGATSHDTAMAAARTWVPPKDV